jgi:hypothetical protein
VFLKSRGLLTFFFLFVLCAQIFALGTSEESEVKVHNDEWILCVTDFDFSSVAEEKLVVASVITKKIVERLNVISYRARVSHEYAYYEGYVWSRARSTAAKALSAKLDERSQLLYRGDPGWKYRQNLSKADAEIEKLRLALDEVEKEAPLINEEPVFRLTDGNKEFTFPAAPKAGGEHRFCTDQKADAFLSGKIFDFHGRYNVSIKLYTVFSQSYAFEDSIIFSPDDLESALDEITRRLLIELSGNKPAKLAIKSQPPDTLVLINRSFAGKGAALDLEYPPGKITITASAADHESMTVETELRPGELAEIDISLHPSEYKEVKIFGPTPEGSVYHGALYVGEAPLTLRLPANTLQYVELEISNRRKGTAVFLTPDNNDYLFSASMRTAVPPKKGRVSTARSLYYWGWGLTWITGIAAWLSFYSYTTADTAIRQNYADTGDVNQSFLDSNVRLYYISMGTAIAAGSLFVIDMFQVGRYLYVGTKGSPAIISVSWK